MKIVGLGVDICEIARMERAIERHPTLRERVFTAEEPFPVTFDDFVETVFGVHGPQVMKDLHVIEQWTGPGSNLG